MPNTRDGIALRFAFANLRILGKISKILLLRLRLRMDLIANANSQTQTQIRKVKNLPSENIQ
jgi:hypothetical protein